MDFEQGGGGNSHKIILDLCGGTGAWSKPYQEAGYDVRVITLPEHDVRTFTPPGCVYGVLAAPPCTDFAVSGAQYWKKKDADGRTQQSLEIALACLRVIEQCAPVFWALENPVGRLKDFIGPYRYTFQPYEYGDPWTKRTCIWGNHNKPEKHPVEIKPIGQWTGRADCHGIIDHLKENTDLLPPDWLMRLPPSPTRQALRSITPPGFARAFFLANP